MVKTELIKSMEVFNELTDEQIAAVREHCEIFDFQMGDKLFTEGDDATQLWFVSGGAVDLRFEMPDGRPTSDKQTVSNIGVAHQDPEAKILGWSCFVPPYKMRLSAYCVTEEARIIRIEKEKLVAIFEDDPEVGYKFLSYLIKVVGYRFHQFQDHVAKNMGEDLMSGW